MSHVIALVAAWGIAVEANAATAADLLARACRAGDLQTAAAFLSSGMDPNLPDGYGNSPLYYAVAFRQPELVNLLLAYHADPNSRSFPLEAAAQAGNLHIAEMLVAAGAQIAAKAANGSTALHAAVIGRHLDVMRFLIEKGADVNARDAEGASPLDEAVWRGMLDETALLMAHGARINEAETKTGATPINEAAYQGNTATVRYLLQFEPDIRIRDKRGYTALDNAIRAGKVDSALLLLEAEAGEQKRPESFQELMHAAAARDEGRVVEAMLRHGASANTANASGVTPLDIAASAGAVQTAGVLLRGGADPNGGARSGTSPLEEAALKGFDAIAAMLLEHGARVNQLNRDSGTTALYAAASFGKGGVVKLLLEHGANPNLCGKSGATAYSAARKNGYSEIASEIQRAGGSQTCQ